MALNPAWTSANAARESFKKVVVNFQEKFLFSSRFQSGNAAYVQSLLERLNLNWKGFSNSHAKVQEFMDYIENDAIILDDTFEMDMEDVSRFYEQASSLIQARLAEIRKTTEIHEPKPDEIALGEFSGKYHEYVLFRASVQARVLNASYPPHIKIDLITKALKGDAKRLIGVVQAQNELEVDRIWTTLEITYNNPYMLKRSVLGQILDLPNLTSSSVAGYRKTIDITKHSLYALSQLELDSKGLHPMVLEILLRKIDVDVLAAWEIRRQTLKDANLEDFFQFLEGQIIILVNTAQKATGSRSASAGAPSTQHQEKPHRSSSVGHYKNNARDSSHFDGQSSKRFKSGNRQSSSANHDDMPPVPAECIMNCKNKNPHYLWYCKKFRALNLTDRIKTIEQNHICKRCVTEKHSMNGCTAKKCPDCSDVHNIILCPKFMVVAKANVAMDSRGHANSSKSYLKK